MFDTGSQTQRLVITVGGTDRNDQRYQCATCVGHDPGSNFGPCVGIYAPAHNIHSAPLASATAFREDPLWLGGSTAEAMTSGTSFAAPIVAGVAARVRQRYPTYNPRQIWDEIRGKATTGAFLGVDINRNGIIDALDRLIYQEGWQ